MSAPLGSGLTGLEIATGLVFGLEPDETSAPSSSSTPLAALEAAVLPALRRPPCLVSFSGGRDSSCMLAVATSVARREGLRLPVPATLRFRKVPEADETDWQELVIAKLGLDEWVRLELDDELDAVGPVATRTLRRFGLLWPFNAYVHVPLIEAARGGSLLTGFGGDELFGWRAGRVNAVLARRLAPAPRDVLRLALALTPWRVRRAWRRRRQSPFQLPWLRPEAQRALDLAWATDDAQEPFALGSRFAWWMRQRRIRVASRSYAVLAGAEDVVIAHPYTDAAFVATIFRTPQLVFADRADRLRTVFGNLLPDELYARRSKASFNRPFFGRYGRALAETWRGEGADPALVDVDALRANWEEDVPDGRGYMLLQAAWLARATAVSSGVDARPRPETTNAGGGATRTPAEQRG